MDADGLHSSMLPVDLSMQQVLLSSTYIVLTATLTHYCKTVLQAAVVEIFMFHATPKSATLELFILSNTSASIYRFSVQSM